MAMATINSAAGPIDTADLGLTLAHEHVYTLNTEMRIQYPWNEEEKVALAVRKLKEIKALGFKTLVDHTCFGLGRYVPRLRRISEESGVQLILCTGLYTFFDIPPFWRSHIRYVSPTFMEDFFVREIEQGVADTGVKPAFLKCATEHYGVVGDVDLVLRATARAHRRTGVPISAHANAQHRMGLEQQKIFREEGVNLSRVIIGHVGDITDISYAESVLEGGSYIGLDRFGSEAILPNKDRIATTIELCKRGHATRIILSHDTNAWSDHSPEVARATNPILKDTRWTYIPEVVIPALREGGVSQSDIDDMMINNIRRIFEVQGPY
jgi:phosphotriesterase-related protein